MLGHGVDPGIASRLSQAYEQQEDELHETMEDVEHLKDQLKATKDALAETKAQLGEDLL